MNRREFLVNSIAASRALSQADSPVIVMLRASDGAILRTSPQAAAWILPPGSTVKPFVLSELLRIRRLRAEETFMCPGGFRFGAHDFACSHPTGLPPMNTARAIAYSCNAAIAHFAKRFAPGELDAALRRSGFRVLGPDSLLHALGEDGVSITPVELARAYRRLAAQIEPAILEGLEGAVQYGTAQAAAVRGMTVAGKTGTATAANGLHAAWFAGFAPSASPSVVAVIALQGHSGGSDAAPTAGKLFAEEAKQEGARYRVRTGSSVRTASVEEYVSAVLVGECGVLQQPEALKAMAVAVRTFAAHERGRHSREGFDFCDTTHCQRAQFDAGNLRTEKAARATYGELLWFEGQPAFTPYSMSCGGMSESGSALWPDVHASYLSIHSDPFCATHEWGRHLAPHEIEGALRSSGLDCPAQLRRVGVLSRTASGRAQQLRLEGQGNTVLNASSFRFAIGRMLGWHLIRSDLYEMSGAVDVRGRGEGHGVGLCQRGAEEMGATGHSYREILAFYYPGSSAINWLRMGGEHATVFGTDLARDRAALAAAERARSQLPWPLTAQVAIYVYPTMDAFRSETHEPGWVAAVTHERRIDLQPVAVLAARGVLDSTLRHELLHVAVEEHAAASLPVWFREGVVEYLAGERRQQSAPMPDDADLRQRDQRANATEAYREASARITGLVRRYGEATVLGWVSSGLPDALRNSITSNENTNSR